MTNFSYSGVQAGKKVTGEISASDLKAASAKLREKKIIVTSIAKSNEKSQKKAMQQHNANLISPTNQYRMHPIE